MIYRVIVTTKSHPRGVSYPGSGHSLYTRDKAISVLRKLHARGHASDYDSEFGAWAEGPEERFTLTDLKIREEKEHHTP